MRDWHALVRRRLGPLERLNLDPSRQNDIVAELAQHASEHFSELIAGGVPDDEAERKALAPLQDPERLAREIARADRPRPGAPPPPAGDGSLLRNVPRDVVYAVRVLRRSPGFAVAALITLALGIGANAAIFSIVDAVALRPPPYRDPDRVLVFLNGRAGDAGTITSSSLPDYEDWQKRLTSFESLGLLSGWTFNVTGLDLPERLFGARVNGSLFPLLGTPAFVGRTIEPADDAAGGDEVLVLSYRVWQRLFGGDRGVIGRPVMLEGRPHIVVGVMPPRFHFPDEATEVWAAMKSNMVGMPRNGRFMAAIGRLRPTATIETAQAEIDTVSAQLEQAYPDTNRGWRVRLTTIHEASVGDARPALVILVGAVALILLIACANVSNLLLARATSRRRETAIRLALGASRGRIAAQWITENLVLSMTGGAIGVALAYGIVRLIVAVGPADVPRLDEAAVDGAVLTFTAVVAVAAGAVPALFPALRAVRSTAPAALKEGAGGYSTTGRSRAGAVLVVVEVALAMTLAVAGALLLKSYARLSAVRPGFDPDHVLSLKVFLTPPRYRSVAQAKQYITSALDRMAGISGVESVAAISQLPIDDPSSTLAFDVEAHPVLPGDRPSAGYRAVSRSYFATMRIPVLRGRGFSDDDREDAPPVVVINEATARRLWPGQDPVGQRIKWATGTAAYDAQWHTVIGVAADVKSSGLDKPEPPAIYAPYIQRPFTWLRWTSFVVRTAGPPDSYARTVRRELAAVDPMQPLYDMAPLEAVIAQSVAGRRFHTGLIDLFAALALTLAAVGVYGTIGYWVSGRSREIGVRMALGATRRHIAVAVLGRAAGLTALGIALGAALSAATSRMLSALLFEVHPFDLPLLSTVAVIVAAVGAAAAYLPARRAALVDPLTVIRGD
jgi:putative ABC transport system permease protein